MSALLDVTDTVSVGDADAVADATARILADCCGARGFDESLLRTSFARVGRMFAGADPAWLACDMPYHDLRHSLDTALVMARLIGGHQRVHGGSPEALAPQDALAGVLLALVHDTGYLRKPAERALCGPQLTAGHELRSVEIAEAFLRSTPLAALAPYATLILATRLAADLDGLFRGRDRTEVTLGRMLATADLVSQLSDCRYLERCYWHLFPELVLGDCNRVRAADGSERPLFRDAFDLVAKTSAFYDGVVRTRLDERLARTDRYAAAHFGSADPYRAAIERNVERARRIAAGREALGAEPPTTTAHLDAVYHAGPAA